MLSIPHTQPTSDRGSAVTSASQLSRSRYSPHDSGCCSTWYAVPGSSRSTQAQILASDSTVEMHSMHSGQVLSSQGRKQLPLQSGTDVPLSGAGQSLAASQSIRQKQLLA